MAESKGFQTEQHKDYMKYIKAKQAEFQQQQQLASLSTSDGTDSGAGSGAAVTTVSSKKKKTADDIEFEFHFADQWKEIRPYFGLVADTAGYISERIRGIKVIREYVCVCVCVCV